MKYNKNEKWRIISLLVILTIFVLLFTKCAPKIDYINTTDITNE